MDIMIKQVEEKDYDEIEFLTRESFWNVYKPGCDEHLVVHNMHRENASIKELELAAIHEGKIVGHIIYSKGHIEGNKNNNLITFGPVSVDVNMQNQGIGSRLIRQSIEIARSLGYEAILITGNPDYYKRFGFVSASQFDIHLEGIPAEDEAPFFMALELKDNALKECHGNYIFNKCYYVDADELNEFEKKFPYKIKEVREGQL